MAALDQIAPVLTALGGVIAAVGAALVAVRQTKGSDGEHTSERQAVAVTNLEQTTIRVDTLWDKISDLIEEVAQLKEDKQMQQDQINKLTDELEAERAEHSKTREQLAKTTDKLTKLMAEHKKTLKLLKEKEAQINKFMKEA